MLRDPVELAAWGWEELGRLEQELRRDAAAGWPRLGLAEEFDIPPQLRVSAGLDDPAAGQVITPQVAVGLLVRHGWQTRDFARSEVLRYLGTPARLSPTGSGNGNGAGCEPRHANASPG